MSDGAVGRIIMSQRPEKWKIYVKRRFNSLFSTKTGYVELDHRIALTKGKETELLLVLDYPETPLHSNTAEIMLSILDTCRKRGASFFEYVRDIFSNRYSMPRLSELVAGGVAEIGVANSRR